MTILFADSFGKMMVNCGILANSIPNPCANFFHNIFPNEGRLIETLKRKPFNLPYKELYFAM